MKAKVIHFEKARQKIRDNRRHRYNARDAYVHFLYQKKYKINSELSDLYMKYLGELKTWIEFKEALPKLEKEREKLKKKEIKFNFTTPKKDWSIYGGWVNPFEPINKGRLGSTQEWRVEKPKKHYY
jgi:Zn-finger domain-containing protein